MATRDHRSDTANDNLDSILEHYGVKGMKWGVRRSRAELASARGERKAAKAERKRVTNTSTGPNSSATRLQKPVGEMSDVELGAVLNRVRMEAQYRDVVATRGQRSRKIAVGLVSNSVQTAAKTAITASATKNMNVAMAAAAKKATKRKKRG